MAGYHGTEGLLCAAPDGAIWSKSLGCIIRQGVAPAALNAVCCDAKPVAGQHPYVKLPRQLPIGSQYCCRFSSDWCRAATDAHTHARAHLNGLF
mmetsp:Transcript_40218/g.106188  ORF Transcript_40218/g.106188 Transcript_40218/m.106188 type:complete len:94 (-) Transcript_40218:20-301(-)